MLKEFIYNILEFISPFIVLISLLVINTYWKKIIAFRILFAYFLSSAINLGFASYLALINKPNINWYNFHGFISLAVLSYFFYVIIRRNNFKIFIKYLSILGLFMYLIILLIWDDNITFFSSGYSIGSLIIITYSLLYLKEVLDNDTIKTDNFIWIVTNLLTYHLGSYLIHVTYKYITQNFLDYNGTENYINPGQLWGIHNVIYFISCLLILINLFKIKRRIV